MVGNIEFLTHFLVLAPVDEALLKDESGARRQLFHMSAYQHDTFLAFQEVGISKILIHLEPRSDKAVVHLNVANVIETFMTNIRQKEKFPVGHILALIIAPGIFESIGHNVTARFLVIEVTICEMEELLIILPVKPFKTFLLVQYNCLLSCKINTKPLFCQIYHLLFSVLSESR